MIYILLGAAAFAVGGFWCACVLGAQEDERTGWK
jgi:hypothetical protein